jgi:tetratricopeptide (TPR) repeat protein
MIRKLFILGLIALPLAALQAQSVNDGIRLIEVERFQDAGRVFRSLAQGNDANNLYYAGYYYARIGKTDSAKMMFDRSAAVDGGKNALSHVGLGTLSILQGNKAEATTHFNEARKRSKERNAEVLYRIGEAYTIFPTTDAPEAIRALMKAAELDKGRADILVMLGDAYLIPNDGSSAATNYDRAKRINANYTKAYTHYGRIMERARNYTEALVQYKQGIAKDSTYTPAYREIAELYTLAGRYPEALVNYRKYVERTDRSPEKLQGLAGYLFLNHQYGEAARLIDELGSQSGGAEKAPIYYRLLAYIQTETGKFQEADQNLTKYMQIAQADTNKNKIIANDYIYQGRIALGLNKDTAQALNMMGRGVAKDSNRVVAFKEIADSAFTAKKYKAAATFYHAYNSYSKTSNANDYFRYGQALYFSKQYHRADSAFQQVTILEPNSPTGILYRGYSAQGLDPQVKQGLAKPYFEEYLAFTGDTAKVKTADKVKFNRQRGVSHAYLALYYLQKNDFDKAEDNAKEALAEDPANTNARKVLDAIPGMRAAQKKNAAAAKSAAGK